MKMSDAIDHAASAFDTAMGVNQPSKPASSSGPVESIFGNGHEDDEPAGGDGVVDDDDPAVGIDPREGDDEPAEGDDEPGEGEDDDEPGEDGDEPGEDDDPDAAALEQKYVVTVDGAEVEVPLREALNGYVRTETFHRRLNQLNEVSNAVTAEATKVAEDRAKYSSLLEEMEAHLAALVPAEPDWAKLAAEDPAKYATLRQQYDEFNKHTSALKEQRVKVKQEQEEADAQSRINYVRSENTKMLRDTTEWSDPKRMKADLTAMAKTATSVGFTQDEVNQVIDSRMLKVLLKASKYDRLMANKPRPVSSKDGKRAQKPVASVSGAGPAVGRTAPKGLARAQKQLARTGSVDAAADFFTGLINSKPRKR